MFPLRTIVVATTAFTARGLQSSGKKPFPKMSPLAVARAAPVDDAFGIANEEAMMNAARQGPRQR